MGKIGNRFFPAFLSIALLILLTACNEQNSKVSAIKVDEAPDPSITITDTTNSTKEDPKIFVFETELNRSLYNQVYWSQPEDGKFYKGQIKTNDVNINQAFANTKVEMGPFPQKYELDVGFSRKVPQPSRILGKMQDNEGHTYMWNQAYTNKDADHNFLVNIPSFNSNSAKIDLRFIWMNNDGKCYGVADKLFILKRQ